MLSSINSIACFSKEKDCLGFAVSLFRGLFQNIVLASTRHNASFIMCNCELSKVLIQFVSTGVGVQPGFSVPQFPL